jgi:hypothetical protein
VQSECGTETSEQVRRNLDLKEMEKSETNGGSLTQSAEGGVDVKATCPKDVPFGGDQTVLRMATTSLKPRPHSTSTFHVHINSRGRLATCIRE